MSLAENIKNARLRKGITQGDLAKKLNKSKNVISNWERGDNKPDADAIALLCEILEVDPNSLLEWEGEDVKLHLSMDEQRLVEKYRSILSWQKNSIQTLLNDFVDHLPSQSDDFAFVAMRSVPYYAISPSAGYGNYIESDPDCSTIDIPDITDNKDIDFILKVDGKSMEPKYKNGSYVKVKKQNELQPHEIGIFIVDGTSLIKQYEVDHLHSINPKYPDIPFSEDMDIRCVGKVIGQWEK